MADIIVTEFMDAGPLEELGRHYRVHVDAQLWAKRSELERLATDAIALIVRNRTEVDAALLAKAPRLRALGRLGVGLDNIDVAACAQRGIAVCPATGANAVSVAEYVIGAILLLSRNAAFQASGALVVGQWPREAAGLGREIAGRTLGIVGFGSIGRTVAERAAAVGLSVIAHDDLVPAGDAAWTLARRVGLAELLAQSDIVTLHCPLTDGTRGLLDAGALATLRKGALLINTARGGIVDEAALAAALRSGHLSGAALDVFAREPIDAITGALFAGLPNVLLTPHVAGVTAESNARISQVTVANVLSALKGAG